ncbi:MAG TPA: hypothetical protein VHY33_00315 [Thermoanaerobaculia bacterium]|jgi:hypothetical protein|nr:hypothetical protein [Thermoanaerobaculia bacterium]
MNRHTALFLAASFLAINGCATHTRTTTPVALNVTSDTATDSFVKQVHDITLDAIEQQVPNAHPMAVNMKLDVTARTLSTPSMAMTFSQPVNQTRPVATISSEKWTDGAPPTVPVNHSVFGTDISQQITGFRVAYTISDAAGKVVESNQLLLDNGQLVDAASHTALKARQGLVADAASFLASRVKALSR